MPEDISILRSLLEATRKLERQFASRGIELHSVAFIRNDIYQHLILEPAERGKETAALLDWNDPEVFKQLLARRLSSGLDGDMDFDNLWTQFFPSHVKGEESFQFVLNRTLMRPRELLRFVRECIDVGVNRRRQKLTEADMLQAEQSYSSDALVDVCLEMRDVNANFADVPYAFIGSKVVLSKADVTTRLEKAGIKPAEVSHVIDILLWFGVMGIYLDDEEERFSYQYEHNSNMLTTGVSHYAYCIHPAFRVALGCTEDN
ncbi:MAG: P-loop ATPase, Sll1717 family [Acidobacteriaceae bacterium]